MDLKRLPVGAYLKTYNGDTSSDSSVSSDDYHASEVVTRIHYPEKDKYGHSDDKSTSITFIENIGKELAQMITKYDCFICGKKGGGHYSAAHHRKKVAAWILDKLKGKEEIPIDRIFCEGCNLPFTQRDLVDDHYKSEYHIKNAESYCFVCQRNISHRLMAVHLQSKMHIKKVAKFSKRAVVSEGANIHTKFSHQDLASELKEKWSAQCCLLCNRTELTQPDHFKTKRHISKVLNWIRAKLATQQFNEINIEDLYCDSCNEVFVNSDVAMLHYSSLEHSRNIENYCKTCHKHVQNINQHVLTNCHIAKCSGPSMNNSDNFESDDTSEEETPAREFSDKQLNDKCTTSAMYDSVIEIAKKLECMLTVTYCGICEQYVNMLMVEHHYLEKEHTLTIRKWLDEELKKAEVKINVTPRLYCEVCFLNLCGTVKALEHYQNASHLYNERTYCSKCLFRGSPDELIEHKSTRLCAGNKSNTVEGIFTRLPRKLPNLILPSCKQCFMKFSTVEQAKSHYDSLSHNDNVQMWINQHSRCETAMLENKVLQQLQTIADKMYFSKTVPFETALIHLKNLNKDIADIGSIHQGLQFKARNINASNVADSPNQQQELSIDKTTWDYSKMKLTMELRRLKLVLENKNRISTNLALQYVRCLNQLIYNLISKGEELDFDQFFDLEDVTFAGPNTEEALGLEIKKLENTLINGKISVYVALDCITEFNIRLESLIDYQENDNSLLDFSDCE